MKPTGVVLPQNRLAMHIHHNAEDYARLIERLCQCLEPCDFQKCLPGPHAWCWRGRHRFHTTHETRFYSGYPEIRFRVIQPNPIGFKMFTAELVVTLNDTSVPKYCTHFHAKKLHASRARYGFFNKSVALAKHAVSLRDYFRRLKSGETI